MKISTTSVIQGNQEKYGSILHGRMLFLVARTFLPQPDMEAYDGPHKDDGFRLQGLGFRKACVSI